MNLHGSIVAIIFGSSSSGVVLLDAFETVVLPRRVTRHFKLTAWFYRRTWIPWKKIAGRIQTPSRQQSFLGYFGPLSLIMLLAFWAATLILGFALLQYGIGGHEQLSGEPITFGRIVYHSGQTFFTLGYGDILPTSSAGARAFGGRSGHGLRISGSGDRLSAGGVRFVFAARDSDLDAGRARRIASHGERVAGAAGGKFGESDDRPDCARWMLRDWERWAGELLESHISYPVLSFFRSQHSNQSWLGALTTMLDVTSLLITGIEGIHPGQARLTFAMARHAAVDLAQVVNARYDPQAPERLTDAEFDTLRETLAAAGLKLRSGRRSTTEVEQLRSMYEPYVHSTAQNLMVTLPPWQHPAKTRDNWQAGPWDRVIQAKGLAVLGQKPVTPLGNEDHF